MSILHEYPITLEWQGSLKGSGHLHLKNSSGPIEVSIPAEFQGLGQGTNPEELLTSSVASCYAITFSLIAMRKKLPVLGLKVQSTGQVEQEGFNLKFVRIDLRPQIKVEGSASEEHLQAILDAAELAEKQCIISQAIQGNVEINLEPSIVSA